MKQIASYFKVLCEKTYFKIKEDNEELEVAYELEMILPNDSKKGRTVEEATQKWSVKFFYRGIKRRRPTSMMLG